MLSSLLCCATVAIAQDETREVDASLSDDEVRAIVLKAADVCRETLPPRKPEIAEQGDYLEVIGPLVSQGDAALPALRRIASSPDLDRFQARLG